MLYHGLEDAVRTYLQEQHPAHDVEIRNGELVVVSPHDLVSSRVVIRLSRLLEEFVDEHALGHVFDSNGGFRYADGDLMAPDISYISRARLPRVPRSFAEATPELVIEIQSSTQRPAAVRAKLRLLLEKGSTVGLYIDPGTHRIEIHRVGNDIVVLGDADLLEIPDVLPGLRVRIAAIWPPDYD